MAEAIKLKQQNGQDLIIYGHGLLGQALLKRHLLDEFRFSIHPVFVGRGKLLFREGEEATLKLVATKIRGNGVVILSSQQAGA